MPAQIYKCTWFFDGVQANPGTTAPSYVGWTETWYRSATTIEDALVTMRSRAISSWVTRRCSFLAGSYRIRWVRASAVANPRLTKTAALLVPEVGTVPLLAPVIPKVAQDAAQVNCCILVDFYAPPQNETDRAHHRRALLRGLPVSLINQNIINEGSPLFDPLLTFCGLIGRVRAPGVANNPSDSGWLIRTNNNVPPFVANTGLVINPANARQITLTAPLGALTRGAKVTVRGVTFPRGVNRVWTVLISPQTTPGQYVLGTARNDLSGAWNSTGTSWVNAYQYLAPSQYLIIGLRDRHTGRPFNLTRGRRRST